MARRSLEQLDLGEVLLARVVRATSLPTPWGLGARFPAGGERRWRARLATLPNDPAQAALALLEFHPDDVAEPLPDTVELQAVKWSIKNDEAVIDVLEHDDSWECLAQALPDGWAFAWPDRDEPGTIDLGGCRQRPGEIEAARLIVRTKPHRPARHRPGPVASDRVAPESQPWRADRRARRAARSVRYVPRCSRRASSAVAPSTG